MAVASGEQRITTTTPQNELFDAHRDYHKKAYEISQRALEAVLNRDGIPRNLDEFMLALHGFTRVTAPQFMEQKYGSIVKDFGRTYGNPIAFFGKHSTRDDKHELREIALVKPRGMGDLHYSSPLKYRIQAVGDSAEGRILLPVSMYQTWDYEGWDNGAYQCQEKYDLPVGWVTSTAYPMAPESSVLSAISTRAESIKIGLNEIYGAYQFDEGRRSQQDKTFLERMALAEAAFDKVWPVEFGAGD